MASKHLNTAHMAVEAAAEDVVVVAAAGEAVRHNKHHTRDSLMDHQIITI